MRTKAGASFCSDGTSIFIQLRNLDMHACLGTIPFGRSSSSIFQNLKYTYSYSSGAKNSYTCLICRTRKNVSYLVCPGNLRKNSLIMRCSRSVSMGHGDKTETQNLEQQWTHSCMRKVLWELPRLALPSPQKISKIFGQESSMGYWKRGEVRFSFCCQFFSSRSAGRKARKDIYHSRTWSPKKNK